VPSVTVALVNSFKRVVSPALVLLYAALEGACSWARSAENTH